MPTDITQLIIDKDLVAIITKGKHKGSIAKVEAEIDQHGYINSCLLKTVDATLQFTSYDKILARAGMFYRRKNDIGQKLDETKGNIGVLHIQGGPELFVEAYKQIHGEFGQDGIIEYYTLFQEAPPEFEGSP